MIDLAHKIIREQIRKYRAAYKTPEEIDNALYRGLIDFYNGLFRSKQNSQQVSRYLTEQVCNITSTNVFPLNPDFNRPVRITSTVGTSVFEGEVLAENEWLDRRNSFILAPTNQQPIARIIGSNIEFYPGDSGNYRLVYYRSPLQPKFNYTVSGGRDVVYNPTGSVNVDVNPSALNDVIVRAVAYLGISLNDQGLLAERQLNGG